MRKNFLSTLFGLGRLPRRIAASLESEGIVALDEGVSASAVLEGFKAPGKRSSRKGSWFLSSLVVTELRFAAFAFSRPVINVPLGDQRLRELEVSAPDRNTLIITFDVSRFHDRMSGQVRCTFKTAKAREFLEHLQAAVSRV